MNISAKKQWVQIFNALFFTLTAYSLMSSAEFLSSKPQWHYSLVKGSDFKISEEAFIASFLFRYKQPHWLPPANDDDSFNQSRACQRSLLPGEPLNHAVASMPEGCELRVQSDHVITDDSIIMRKGQSIRVKTTQGHYQRLRSDYVVQYTDQAYQLIAVTPKQWQTISGENTTTVIAQKPDEPTFIIDGPGIYIDSHLILPPVEPGSGRTGIILTNPQWYESLQISPEVDPDTNLPDRGGGGISQFI